MIKKLFTKKILHTHIFFLILISIFWTISVEIDGLAKFPKLSVACIIFTYILSYKIRTIPDRIYKFSNIIKYIYWLIGEVVNSSLSIAKTVWQRDLKLEPTFVELESKLDPDSAEIVIYGTSIILTPGTFTISISNDAKLLVHSFNKENAKNLQTGTMEDKVSECFS